ncbi:hypothetical protein TCAL_05028 [Tigriopus californicus]|uniref:Uncharacterized protein n=1 Tax=Tigriopus californicus TaxID=6832 RepID=A0A553P9R4_TIGCA|nr:ankyrin homolog [Tigriopus californicus]TRY74435.1 hypothetical protein TCAL_05028 [Tigriopus californicus]|eukprot:TCALIF_05028-PA protein Name:"Similar to ANKS1A Ankyrin repeat and SAM domain-containing protein 1A (Homo sapiens)" AED:0.48 eAED:0.48 QI:0/-1/0/1/-1/1/1/0/281
MNSHRHLLRSLITPAVFGMACRGSEDEIKEQIHLSIHPHHRLLEYKDSQGKTMLQHASYCGQVGLVSFLLKMGANTQSRDSQGLQALHYAAAVGSVSTLDQLLSLDQSVNGRSNAGNTALMCAVQFGHAKAVRFLLDQGAQTTLQNNRGQSALEMAIVGDQCPLEVLDMLLDDPDCRVEIMANGGRFLSLAALTDNVKKCEAMIRVLPKDYKFDTLDESDNPILRLAQRSQGYPRANELEIVQKIAQKFPKLLHFLYQEGLQTPISVKNRLHFLCQIVKAN